MTSRLCLLVSAHDGRAQRWARWLRAEGWHVERVATVAACHVRLREGGAARQVALVDLELTRPHPAGAFGRLKAEAAGWVFAIVAEDADAFGPHLSEALGSGAADVIAATTDAEALSSRLDGLGGASSPVLSLADGRIRLDRMKRQAWAGRARPRPLSLTPTEFELLAALLESPGRVVSRRELIDRLWPGEEVNPETVDRHVGSLRRKLASFGDRIKTAHGVGYAAG